ncbi:unnamed protein product [Arctogadus glacialis]
MLNMGAVLLLLTGVETFCDATQPHITTQCSGSLGGTVEVQLPKTSQDDTYRLMKNNVLILSDRIQTTNIRYSFNVSTGLFAIKEFNRTDKGTYSLEVHDQNGTEISFNQFRLTIEGVKTFCDATQPHITTQCSGSLGGTVEVQLPTKTSQDDIYKLKKNNVTIVKYKSQTKNVDYSFNVNTGIFTIHDINRKEDGTYSIEAHNRNGTDLSNIQFNLSIQAPVSSPLLSRECLSRGQQRVSCSAGGDGLHFSLSLDGLPLNDPRLLSGPSSASDVTLEPGRSGLLSCSVRNNVSHAAANITLSVCDGFIYVNCTSNGTHIPQWVHRDNVTLCSGTADGQDPKKMGLVPIIAGSLSVMALLLIVALGVYCAKKHKTSKDTTEAEDVIYADVSVLQRRGPRREQGEGEVEEEVEEEVEYAAVRLAPGSRRTLETNVDECVYAQPQRKRP